VGERLVRGSPGQKDFGIRLARDALGKPCPGLRGPALGGAIDGTGVNHDQSITVAHAQCQ